MTLAANAAAFLALAGLVVVLLPRTPLRSVPPPPRALLSWVGAVAAAGLLLPAIVITGSLMAARSAEASAALLAGLVIQIATEAVLSRRGRPDLRAITGLCFTLARCAQVGLLWLDPPVGADAAVLIVATVVWPANVVVLLTVMMRWRRRRPRPSAPTPAGPAPAGSPPPRTRRPRPAPRP